MALYASGKVAAIATIKAAVAARTTTLSDGSRSLDLASLSQWLADQGNAIVELDVAPINRPAARGVLATVDARPDTQALADYIGPSHWQSRPDWPSPLALSSGQSFITAAVALMQEMDRAVRSLEDVYEQVHGKIAEVLAAASDELALHAKLPDTEVSLVDPRFYIYTYVTEWDEESAPSPVSEMVSCDQNDVVNITIGAEPPGRYINRWRFYRTNTGSAGADFQFLAEGVIGLKYGVDDAKPAELGEVCPTLLWAEPPAKLQGLVEMPNGVLAGFYDNAVCFSEPFVPYAWPVAYQITTATPIVGLAVFGQTLVVGTHGGADFISGADAASMSQQQSVSLQACVAARSMVTVEGGAVYASPDGLCLATANGVRLLTADHYTREDWQKLSPASMVSAYHEGTYFFHVVSASGPLCLALHLETGKLTTLSVTGSTFYHDTLTDRLYTAQGNNVVALFAGSTYRTGRWRSKIIVLPRHESLAWLTVESDFSSPVTVKLYGDGVLRHTAVLASRAPVRLPPGRWLEHEVEVSSQARWNALTLTSTTQELQSV